MKESDALWFCRMKLNIKNARRAQMHNNWEHVTTKFYSVDGGRGMEHYNFREKDNHNNVITLNGIFAKLKHFGDGRPANM
jgi:hypothetical protein